ncbi:MAG: hypothetical protein WCB27_01490 [Thermoguttaceae bacterium]|jgi:hypothetical protein
MRRIYWPLVLLLLTASCTSVQTNRKMPPPFQLTADEEKSVDRLLARWEQWNAGVKTFDCRFKRWTYDAVFGPPNQPRWVDLGQIKYAAPDHALYRVDTTEKDDKQLPIEVARAEHWAFDGKSIFEVDSARAKVVEFRLESKQVKFDTSGYVNGPLSFCFPGGFYVRILPFGPPPVPCPFGANAHEIKERCYVREITPPAKRQEEIWLEAYPRTMPGIGGLFSKLQLIFRVSDMAPCAIKVVEPNGKDYIVYQFYDMAVNKPLTPEDPFHPPVPKGWRKIVEELPSGQ